MGSRLNWAKALADAKHAKWPQVLKFLLDAWRGSFAVEVADAIERVSPHTGAPLTGSAWSKAAKTHQPENLGPLLDAVTAETTSVAMERVEALAGWAEDPRLERWVVSHFENVTYRAGSARPFWTRLKKLVPALHDERAIERLRAVIARYDTTDWVERDLKDVAQKWLDQALVKAKPHLAKADPGLVDRKALGPLLATLPVRENVGATIDAQLLGAPKAPGARDVAADALMELGAVRGELIALQRQPATAENARAIKALVGKNLEALLGPLRDVVLKDGLVFENGYLTRATLSSANPRSLDKVVESPFWSTVQAVDVRRTRVNWVPVLTSKTLSSLTSLRTDDWDLAQALSEGAVALPSVTSLRLDLPEKGLGPFTGVPKLNDLTVGCGASELAKVRSWASKRRLERWGVVIGLDYDLAVESLPALKTWWKGVPATRAAGLEIDRLTRKGYGSRYEYDLATKRLDVHFFGNDVWLGKSVEDVCTLLDWWRLPGTIHWPRGFKLAAHPALAKVLKACSFEVAN